MEISCKGKCLVNALLLLVTFSNNAWALAPTAKGAHPAAPKGPAGGSVSGGSASSAEWQALKKAGDQASVRGTAAEAEGKYRAALASAEKAKDNKGILSCISALANVLVADRTRLGEEEPLRQRALQLAEQLFGATSPPYAAKLGEFADCLARKGDIAGAEESTDRAMAILSQSEDKYPLEMAACYQALADRQVSLGTLGLAANSFQKVYELRSSKLPADDPSVLDACKGYAVLLRQLDRKDEAAKLEQQIMLAKAEPAAGAVSGSVDISVKKANKGDDKSAFLKLLAEAKAADKAEDREKSLSCWKLVVQEAEKSDAKDGRLPYALLHLADANQALKNKDEAAATYKRAMDIRQQQGAGKSLGMARNLARIAGLAMQSKNPNEADKLYSQALEIDDQVSAPDLVTSIALQNILSTSMMTGNNAKGEQTARRLMQLADKQGGAFGTMQKRMAVGMLGGIYIKSGRLNEGMELMKSISQLPRSDGQDMAQSLKETYASAEALVDKAEEAGFTN